jgi:hypothetical protein
MEFAMARVVIPRILAAAATAFCAVLGPMTGTAADTAPSSRVEVTLFGGYRFGGTGGVQESTPVTVDGVTSNKLVDVDLEKGASYGLALNWEGESDSFYELAYSKQKSTLDASTPLGVSVEYLQIGGYTLVGANKGRVLPYFLLTVGFGRLTPDEPDLQATTRFAAAIGGGVKVPFTPHITLRIDGRVYATFLDGEKDIFCRSADDPACTIRLQGSTLIQPEISLGFTYGF